IPTGGGWRAHGRGNDAWRGHAAVGYAYIHTAIDSYSRVAYSEVLADERAVTAIAFWRRAHSWFAAHHIDVETVQTDNGSCHRSHTSLGGQPPMTRLNNVAGQHT